MSTQPPVADQPTSCGARTGPRSGRSGRSRTPWRTSTTGRSAQCRRRCSRSSSPGGSGWRANPVRFFLRELPAALAGPRPRSVSSSARSRSSLAFVRNATCGASTVLSRVPARCGRRDPADRPQRTAPCASPPTAGPPTPARGSSPCTSRWRADDDEVLAPVLGAVHDRTRLIVLDHVTSPTARRMPLVTLLPALQERGTRRARRRRARRRACWPSTSSGLGADFCVGNLHKWCCAPRGTAVLHAAPEHRRRTCARSSPPGASRTAFPLSFNDVGTEDLTAWLSAPRALRVLDQLGLDRLRRHNVELAVPASSSSPRHWASIRPTCPGTPP